MNNKSSNSPQERTDLLEELSKLLDCNVSDLKEDSMKSRIHRELRKIASLAFPLSEWNKASNYITGEKACFDTIELAHIHLLAITVRHTF